MTGRAKYKTSIELQEEIKDCQAIIRKNREILKKRKMRERYEISAR
jgi:hypothetical protein